jgi:ribosomal protein L20
VPRTTKENLKPRKHKAVIARTKGHYGARSRLFKTAKQSLIKSLQYAYRDRKNRKRDFRRLWITRINAEVRNLGYTYSKFIAGLNNKGIELDRKMLSELAIQDKATFEKVVKTAID